MPSKEITKFFSNEGTRNEVRLRVVKSFSKEKPGTGNGENASKYIYYVETLQNGDRIYLKRPAYKHNGFDFLICVENANYAKPGEKKAIRNDPKHEDITEDLLAKKNENPEMYAKLYDLMRKVYECNDVTNEEISEIIFNTGYSVEHIIKVIKWMFIEQDIRYWNYSGREKTWKEVIPEIN